MYKAFFSILTILLIVSTVFMAVISPKMHKNILMYDSGLQIVLQDNNTVKNEAAPAQINTVKQQSAPQRPTVSVKDTIADTAVNVVQMPVNVTNTPVNVTRQQANVQPQTVVKTPAPKTVTKQPPVQKTQSIEPKPVQKTETRPKAQPAAKPVTKTVEKQAESKQSAKTAAQKEQEELILWNKWRSDLQNRIMTDVKLPIVRQGTVFRFSFDVDKYGKITNVYTSSDDPNYTPYAIQYIAPVIRSYQGRDFMRFPTGSTRITTTVLGAWKISDKTTYSTPADYKDVEKVRN